MNSAIESIETLVTFYKSTSITTSVKGQIIYNTSEISKLKWDDPEIFYVCLFKKNSQADILMGYAMLKLDYYTTLHTMQNETTDNAINVTNTNNMNVCTSVINITENDLVDVSTNTVYKNGRLTSVEKPILLKMLMVSTDFPKQIIGMKLMKFASVNFFGRKICSFSSGTNLDCELWGGKTVDAGKYLPKDKLANVANVVCYEW